MSKHTPGPWKTLAGDWDKQLGGYCRYTIEPLRTLNMSDAHLIAAAPEMYEALKGMLHLWAETAKDAMPDELFEKATNAVLKAEGRTA